MSLVEFKKPWKIYSPGDVTGQDQETVDALVRSGHAISLNDDGTTPEQPADGKEAAANTKTAGKK